MIKIRIKLGYQIDGEGESLGTDYEGNQHTFWKSSGSMEVPLEIAKKLELEKPQRFEIIDRTLADKIMADKPIITQPEKIEESQDINSILDQVEKAIALRKDEQLDLLKKLKITPDEKGLEFDRVRKIILSGHKL